MYILHFVHKSNDENATENSTRDIHFTQMALYNSLPIDSTALHRNNFKEEIVVELLSVDVVVVQCSLFSLQRTTIGNCMRFRLKLRLCIYAAHDIA